MRKFLINHFYHSWLGLRKRMHTAAWRAEQIRKELNKQSTGEQDARGVEPTWYTQRVVSEELWWDELNVCYCMNHLGEISDAWTEHKRTRHKRSGANINMNWEGLRKNSEVKWKKHEQTCNEWAKGKEWNYCLKAFYQRSTRFQTQLRQILKWKDW